MTSISCGQVKDGEFEFELDNFYSKEISRVKIEYRKKLAAYFDKKSTKIEILLLGERVKNPTLTEYDQPDVFFFVEAKEGYYNVKKVKKLERGEIAAISNHLRKMVTESSNDVVFDHVPDYGIRVYDGKLLVFQTSISKKFSNWSMIYPGVPLDVDWLGYNSKEFDEFLSKIFQ
jgi:hypothetical protein